MSIFLGVLRVMGFKWEGDEVEVEVGEGGRRTEVCMWRKVYIE
jgi:hypothetical protein